MARAWRAFRSDPRLADRCSRPAPGGPKSVVRHTGRMADTQARAAELDQLADDLEALLNDDEPFGDRPGPFIANSDTEHSGYESVAAYARERAAWLRAQV